MRHHVQEKRKQRKGSQGKIPIEDIQDIVSWPAREDLTYDANYRSGVSWVDARESSADSQDSSVCKIS